MNLASAQEKRVRESERGAMAKHSLALAVNKPPQFFFSNAQRRSLKRKWRVCEQVIELYTRRGKFKGSTVIR